MKRHSSSKCSSSWALVSLNGTGLILPLQRLQELHLQENSIETLEDQALAGLSSLALLDLSKNNLRTISRVALRPLISLQVLRLTGECASSSCRSRVPSLPWSFQMASHILSPVSPRGNVGQQERPESINPELSRKNGWVGSSAWRLVAPVA